MELTSCGDTITKFINTLVRDYTTSHSDMYPLRLSDLNQLKYVWYPHDASSAAIDIEPNTIYIRSADVLNGAELAEDWRLPEQVLLCEYLLQPKCFIPILNDIASVLHIRRSDTDIDHTYLSKVHDAYRLHILYANCIVRIQRPNAVYDELSMLFGVRGMNYRIEVKQLKYEKRLIERRMTKKYKNRIGLLSMRLLEISLKQPEYKQPEPEETYEDHPDPNKPAERDGHGSVLRREAGGTDIMHREPLWNSIKYAAIDLYNTLRDIGHGNTDDPYTYL